MFGELIPDRDRLQKLVDEKSAEKCLCKIRRLSKAIEASSRKGERAIWQRIDENHAEYIKSAFEKMGYRTEITTGPCCGYGTQVNISLEPLTPEKLNALIANLKPKRVCAECSKPFILPEKKSLLGWGWGIFGAILGIATTITCYKLVLSAW